MSPTHALRPLLLVVVLLVTLATTGSAGEGDDAYRQWIVHCIEALRSDDDAVRTGAEAALATMGAGAMQVILPELERLEADRDWQALACALNGMGAKVAVGALQSYAALFPKSLKKRFYPLHGSIDTEKPPEEPGTSDSTPRISLLIERELRKLNSSNWYHRDDPRLKAMVDCGSEALPTLIAALWRSGDAAECARDGVKALMEPAALPHLQDLIAHGNRRAAGIAATQGGDAALQSQLAALKRGVVDVRFFANLPRTRGDTPIARAVLAYVEQQSFSKGSAALDAIGWLAKRGATFAGPRIHSLSKDLDPYLRARYASAAYRLGVRHALPELIDLVEQQLAGDPRSDELDNVGQMFNRLAWRRLYRGAGDTPKATLARIRKWFTETAPHLEYDETYAVWFDAREDR